MYHKIFFFASIITVKLIAVVLYYMAFEDNNLMIYSEYTDEHFYIEEIIYIRDNFDLYNPFAVIKDFLDNVRFSTHFGYQYIFGIIGLLGGDEMNVRIVNLLLSILISFLSYRASYIYTGDQRFSVYLGGAVLCWPTLNIYSFSTLKEVWCIFLTVLFVHQSAVISRHGANFQIVTLLFFSATLILVSRSPIIVSFMLAYLITAFFYTKNKSKILLAFLFLLSLVYYFYPIILNNISYRISIIDLNVFFNVISQAIGPMFMNGVDGFRFFDSMLFPVKLFLFMVFLRVLFAIAVYSRNIELVSFGLGVLILMVAVSFNGSVLRYQAQIHVLMLIYVFSYYGLKNAQGAIFKYGR